jgi:DNA-binding transcriptional regulator YdaS (Cro superfamily)
MKDSCHLALLKACRILGGQKQLAEKIKIHPSRLNKWINRSKRVIPYACALEIEQATEGQVTCHELLPEWEKVVKHCRQTEK